MRHRSSGFTLVELLVVIAIIGILIALLLPAVQAAREAARRSQCSNNLKQIGIAVQNYHDTYKVFPPAFINNSYRSSNPGPVLRADPQWGWSALVLPFMEQQALFDSLSVGAVPFSAAVAIPGTGGQPLVASPVATMRCPSDVGPETNPGVGRTIGGVEVATSNYVANWGSWSGNMRIPYNADQRLTRGPFVESYGTSISEISDGTSNVLAVGERRWQLTGSQGGTFPAQAANMFGIEYSQGTDAGLRRSAQVTEGRIKPNWNYVPDPDNPNLNRPSRGSSSMHPGGTQFVFCDGSVHFISETIEFGPDPDGNQYANSRTPMGTYQRLHAISDGDPVGDF